MVNLERIAILSVHTCPLATLGGKKTGGMNVYVRELSRELGRRGLAVDVFTRTQDSCQPHLHDGEIGPGARVIHLPAGPESSSDWGVIAEHVPAFVAEVKAFAEEEGLHYDLIHSHYWLSGWVAEELREAWGAPVLHMFHTLGHMKNRVAQNPTQKEDPLRVTVEKRLVESVDLILAATPAERAQLMWLYDADMRKIKIVAPGVDTRRFQPLPRREARREIGASEDGYLLLFVGRIEPLKGIDTLIRAAAILCEERTDICVIIIGGDPEEDTPGVDTELARLKDLREELGLTELVSFVGARDQDRLQYYYSAAHALVMPSDYESFGMVALEAMACGTPVIASEIGGLAYLVQDGLTGFHVPYRDPEELAGKIRLLIDNPALRAEMSGEAIKHAQTYDWTLIAEQMLAVYDDVLGPNATGG